MPLPPSSIGLSADAPGEGKDSAPVASAAAAAEEAKSRDVEEGECGGSEAVPAVPVLAIVPFRSSGKGGGKGALTPFRKKLFRELGEKPIEESIAELQAALRGADAREEAAAALVAEKDVVLQEAQSEFDAANAEVVAAIAQEVEAANAWQSLRTRLEQQRETANNSRVALLEAQQKLAMLEVVATNQRQMRAFEEQRQAALAAAGEAKRRLQEHKRSSMKASLEKLAPFRGTKRANTSAADGDGEGQQELQAAAAAAENGAEPRVEEVNPEVAAGAAAEEGAGAEEQQVTSPLATEATAQEATAPEALLHA